MVAQTPVFLPDEILAISARISKETVAWPTLDDRVNPLSFSGAARSIVDMARQDGFLIYGARGSDPKIYIIGNLHDFVPRSTTETLLTPAGCLLGGLLRAGHLALQDELLVEGVLIGETVDDTFYAQDGSCESYLVENRARLREAGVIPVGNDNKLLMLRHLEFLRHAAEAEQGGRPESVPGYLSAAAEMSSLRDLRYLERMLDGHCRGRTFLYVGATHLFAGVIQERLERAGRDYVAFVERNPDMRVRALAAK